MDNTSFCASPEAAFVSSAEEAASEPAAWLPVAVVSVGCAAAGGKHHCCAKYNCCCFFMVFLLFLSFEIIFLRVDRISAPAMDH